MLTLLVLTALQVAPAPPRLYTVGPNDVLLVTVCNQPQLSGKFAVEADGTFAFPLLGRVRAGGLSVRRLRTRCDNVWRPGLSTTRRSASHRPVRSQQIFVMGEVKQPGSLQFTGSMTLIEALARAGSMTEHAGTDVVIMRSSNASKISGSSSKSKRPW